MFLDTFAECGELIRSTVVHERDGTVGRYAIAPPASAATLAAIVERLGCEPPEVVELASQTTAIHPDFEEAGFSFSIDPGAGSLRDLSSLGLGALFSIHESTSVILAIEPRVEAPSRVWAIEIERGGVVLVSRTLLRFTQEAAFFAHYLVHLQRPRAREIEIDWEAQWERAPIHEPSWGIMPRRREEMDVSREVDPSVRAFLGALDPSALVYDLRDRVRTVSLACRTGAPYCARCRENINPLDMPDVASVWPWSQPSRCYCGGVGRPHEGRWSRCDVVVAWTPRS